MNSPTRPRRVALALVALGLAVSACASADSDDEATATPAPSETAAAPEPSPVVVPEALRFTAPLVGGGEFDGAAVADKPTLFWFWAPT